MKKIEIRKNGTKRVHTINDEPSKTDQSFAAESDVNNIMSHYKRTGQMLHLNRFRGEYADISEIPDLLEAKTQVAQAEEAFMLLPAHTREKFQNNPAHMISFLKDSNNLEESYTLGLRVRPRQEESLSQTIETALDNHETKKSKSKKD